MLRKKKFAIVDIETTGGKSQYHRIIEVGIVCIENGEVVREYSTLVNPQQEIPPTITHLTGIRPSDVADAPTFAEVADDIASILEGSIFVAHNVRFDYGFIKNELLRAGIEYNARCLCTVRLSRMLYPQERRHNLSSIIERFGLTCANRHRALDDARAVWHFMDKSGRQLGEVFGDSMKQLLKRPTLPPYIRNTTVDDLPEEPGAYIFYGENGAVLYVGKSVNLRQRILSHFSNDHRSPREMNLCQQVSDIEVRRTSGELGALLLESHLIKELQPIFNRRSRHQNVLTILRRHEDALGYHNLKIETLDALLAADLGSVAGLFKTKKQARDFLQKATREYQLCGRLSGLQKGAAGEACFSYHLHTCKGACLGKEAPVAYNIRLAQAVHKRKIMAWPFDGPIIIEEDNVRRHYGEAFVVDQWCLVKALRYTEDGEVPFFEGAPRFDHDIYKILCTYVSKHIHTIKLYRPASREVMDAPALEVFSV